MNDSDERINAQLISYFEKVIENTAINYYKKKKSREEREIFDFPFEEIMVEQDMIPILKPVTIYNTPIMVDNEELELILTSLKEKELTFLVEKFVFEKTDREIGELLGVSRQAITNLKHRLYDKFRSQL